MKTPITDEVLRQLEITAMVLQKPDHYSEFDLAENMKVSVQTIRGDMKNLRSKEIDIHSTRNTLSITGDLSLNTLNYLICTCLSLNKNEFIKNLSLLKKKFKNDLVYYFVELIKAINDKRLIKFKYKYTENFVSVKMLPITISRIGKTFYVVGYVNEDSKDIRHYLLERMSEFEFTVQKSGIKEIPDTSSLYRFSWGSYLSTNSVKVKLLFETETGAGMKDKFYIENQKFEETKDGWIMELEVNLSYEFISWVMGFGDKVRVIKPKALVNEILERANGLINNYKI